MPDQGTERIAIARRTATVIVVAIAPLLLSFGVAATPRVAAGQDGPARPDDAQSAFDARRARGVGIFLTGRQLEPGQKRTLGDLLRRVPGMPAPRAAADGSRAEPTPWAATTPSYAASNARGRYGSEYSALNACPVVFYLNGMRVNRGSEVTPDDVADLYAMPADQLAGVEVYRGPSEIPLELSGADARCAVVGLWTRPGG